MVWSDQAGNSIHKEIFEIMVSMFTSLVLAKAESGIRVEPRLSRFIKTEFRQIEYPDGPEKDLDDGVTIIGFILYSVDGLKIFFFHNLQRNAEKNNNNIHKLNHIRFCTLNSDL